MNHFSVLDPYMLSCPMTISFYDVQRYGSSPQRRSSATDPFDKDKFAPRFDGLRFIETLVTAHK